MAGNEIIALEKYKRKIKIFLNINKEICSFKSGTDHLKSNLIQDLLCMRKADYFKVNNNILTYFY